MAVGWAVGVAVGSGVAEMVEVGVGVVWRVVLMGTAAMGVDTAVSPPTTSVTAVAVATSSIGTQPTIKITIRQKHPLKIRQTGFLNILLSSLFYTSITATTASPLHDQSLIAERFLVIHL
ncbi:MAG: hypothetical protein H6658_07775 [Ardenticatenaceae bacterium]|nr:hypothetical protein [Ardenticatenaceae bacterium]